jgi:hypothetical protein
MLGFKSFWTAHVVLGGIELVHMLPERRTCVRSSPGPMPAAEAFCGLAA